MSGSFRNFWNSHAVLPEKWLPGVPSRMILLLAGLLSFGNVLSTPVSAARVSQATAAARVEQREQQVRQVRPENYDLSRYPVTNANEDFWRNMLWTTAIVEPQEAYVTDAISQIISLTSRNNLTDSQKRTIDMAMQVGTQLYLSNPKVYGRLGQQFMTTLEQSQDSQWVAMALSALVKSGLDAGQQQQLGDYVRQRFPRWSADVHLYATLQDIEQQTAPTATPPLDDLLNWTIAPGQLQLYVLCRPDRGTLCQTVLKDRNGEFVRQPNGELWSVPLLLRSIHELSWIFTRGQTPQGIYRIEGTVPQPDTEFFRAYGLFSLVNLYVPFEAGVRQFVPGQRGRLTGNLSTYQALLPPSWRSYFPIQQTYWAGKAGRSLFRIHGTGEHPTFFSNNSRYPTSGEWNPSIGCLSALELYNETGQLQQADMPKILSALSAAGGQNFTGYLVVVELPAASDTPVSLDEIEGLIQNGSVARSQEF